MTGPARLVNLHPWEITAAISAGVALAAVKVLLMYGWRRLTAPKARHRRRSQKSGAATTR